MGNILNWFKINLLKVRPGKFWFMILGKNNVSDKKMKIGFMSMWRKWRIFFLIRDYNWWKKLQEACIHFMEKGNVQNYDEL